MVLALAREWYEVASGDRSLGKDEVSRFMVLWVGFNALYALEFDHVDGDRKQVRLFADYPRAKNAHEEALSGSDTRYTTAVKTLAQRGVYNFRNQERLRLEDESNLGQVMELVYQVRCNLFHGRKSPHDLRDRKLIKAAHTIVSQLMQRLTEDKVSTSDGAAEDSVC